MFKTIFGKLVAIFLIILVIAFTITGISLNFLLDRYLTDQKAQALEDSCDGINQIFGLYVESKGSFLAERYLDNTLEAYNAYTNSLIWIVSETGHIIKSSPDSPQMEKILKKYEDENSYPKLPEPKQYAKVMSSSDAVKEVGDFYGFFKDPAFGKYKDEAWLTVAKSFPYTDQNNKDIRVAVYLHTPVPGVRETRDKVFGYFLISVGVAVFISIILIYILFKVFKAIKADQECGKGYLRRRIQQKA